MKNEMHIWNDDWKHWQDLEDAHIYIRECVAKQLPNCYFSTKEKYGTLRYEHISPTLESEELYNSNPILWYETHWQVVADIIKKAAEKWPNVITELVVDFYEPNYLSPELQQIVDQYWTSE